MATQTPVFLPGKFHEQISLAGYSPWSRKESDTTEQLTHTHLFYNEISRGTMWLCAVVNIITGSGTLEDRIQHSVSLNNGDRQVISYFHEKSSFHVKHFI